MSRQKYFQGTGLLGIFLASLVMGDAAHANPEDGVVAAGSATITEAGKKLDIHQSTDKVVIDWRAFNIAPDEHTQFYQPNSGSIALNRISSGDASQIMGKLSANRKNRSLMGSLLFSHGNRFRLAAGCASLPRHRRILRRRSPHWDWRCRATRRLVPGKKSNRQIRLAARLGIAGEK